MEGGACAAGFVYVFPANWSCAWWWNLHEYGTEEWLCTCCCSQDPDSVIPYENANVIEGLIKKINRGEQPFKVRECGDAGFQGDQVSAGRVL